MAAGVNSQRERGIRTRPRVRAPPPRPTQVPAARRLGVLPRAGHPRHRLRERRRPRERPRGRRGGRRPPRRAESRAGVAALGVAAQHHRVAAELEPRADPGERRGGGVRVAGRGHGGARRLGRGPALLLGRGGHRGQGHASGGVVSLARAPRKTQSATHSCALARAAGCSAASGWGSVLGPTRV